MQHLTPDEIELLMNGLDAIQKAESSQQFSSMLLGAMLSKGKEQRDEIFEEHRRDMEAAKEKDRVLAERVILVKAKLIHMRDQEEVENIL